METLTNAYKKQYGSTPYYLRYDMVTEDMVKEDYWNKFRVNYKEVITTDLLKLLNWARKDKSQISNKGNEWEWAREELSKIITALKTVLATREHVPNKKEREEIRKQKMIDKKNR